jgi:hypothetical protein
MLFPVIEVTRKKHFLSGKYEFAKGNYALLKLAKASPVI